MKKIFRAVFIIALLAIFISGSSSFAYEVGPAQSDTYLYTKKSAGLLYDSAKGSNSVVPVDIEVRGGGLAGVISAEMLVAGSWVYSGDEYYPSGTLAEGQTEAAALSMCDTVVRDILVFHESSELNLRITSGGSIRSEGYVYGGAVFPLYTVSGGQKLISGMTTPAGAKYFLSRDISSASNFSLSPSVNGIKLYNEQKLGKLFFAQDVSFPISADISGFSLNTRLVFEPVWYCFMNDEQIASLNYLKTYTTDELAAMLGYYGTVGNFESYTAPPPPSPSDKASAWAVPEIELAHKLGLIPGKLHGRYTEPMTRGEFCQLGVQLFETASGKELTKLKDFTDTDDLNIRKLAGADIIEGVGDDKFNPNSPLTREQAATIIARLMSALGKPLTEFVPTFSDAESISDWAVQAVGMVQNAEIMQGTGNNLFSPSGTYTREQCMVTMLRVFNSYT